MYEGVELEFVPKKRPTMTVFDDGVEVKRVDLVDIPTKKALHRMMTKLGFPVKSVEDIVAAKERRVRLVQEEEEKYKEEKARIRKLKDERDNEELRRVTELAHKRRKAQQEQKAKEEAEKKEQQQQQEHSPKEDL